MFITFDPYRTLGMEHVTYIKPDHMNQHIREIMNAEAVLFPEYWQVNTLVYGLKKRIFPSIETYHLGHDKMEMTRAFQSVFPESIPYTEILPNTPFYQEQALSTFFFPFVAKIPRSSMGNGVFLIENRNDYNHYISNTDVLYLQEYLPIEKDLRVIYIGNNIVDAYWREAEGAFLNNVSKGGKVLHENIPKKALDLVESVASHFHIDHAGFDVAIYENQPYLFEFNRLFGNSGTDSKKIIDSISSILQNEKNG